MKLLFGLLSSGMAKDGFACGEAALDMYLRRQVSHDMKRGFATVIAAWAETAPNKIIDYYTLSATSVLLDRLPERLACKMLRYPDVPAVRLDRLAVDSRLQGQHIGSLLVLDALRRSCANELAWALFLVDAKDERVTVFYKKFLFQRFADNSLNLWMHRKQAENLITKISA